MANAYFQIIMNGTKTFLRIFPATEGGQGLSAKEIQEYLSFNNIVPETTDYLMIAGSATEQTDVLLCNKTGFAINEYFKLALSQDKMMAVARFYPASSGGKRLSKDEIINDIKHKGIVTEPIESTIDDFINNPMYCYSYVVAKGELPIEGKHAKIEYFFNTNPNTRPALN